MALPSEPDVPDLTTWIAGARRWLDAHAERRRDVDASGDDGGGDVSLFKNLTPDDERAHIDALLGWHRLKTDAGYGSITWPVEHGGAGLPPAYDQAFTILEDEYATPGGHEAVTISRDLVAPTILALGTDRQRRRFVGPLRRGDALCCQMFSEPNAGSDLGAIATRAERDGDTWVLDGQKVWTSGALHADLGYVICRTDSDARKQEALTAFLLPMSTLGVEVRPLRQMTGGSSFNEVFLTDVRVPDDLRLGPVGGGWRSLLTTLGFERSSATGDGLLPPVDLVARLTALARHLGRDRDPVVRRALVDVHVGARLRSLDGRRAAAARVGGEPPGPETSLLKLSFSRWLAQVSATASLVLGPRLVADAGDRGTFAWSEFVTGAPGYRIGGGSDEIQLNTLAEHCLGLPAGPR